MLDEISGVIAPTSARNGNTAVDGNPGLRLKPPYLTGGQARTDSIALPVELHQFRPSGASVARSVTVRAKYLSCLGSGTNSIPAAAPAVSVRVFVKHYAG